MKERIFTIVLWIAALAGTGYLLMLGFYYVLALDDYGWIWQAEQGYWKLIEYTYMEWQSRFTAYMVDGALWILMGRMTNWLPWTILQLAVGYVSAWLLWRSTGHIKDVWNQWGLAILTTNIGILAMFEPSTFFWVCCPNYIHAIWATELLVYFNFFSKEKHWFRWLMVVLCAFYISGNAENYTPLVCMVWGCIFLWQFFVKKQHKWWQNEEVHMALIATLIIGAGFLAQLFAPGNAVRLQYEGTRRFMGHFALIPFMKSTVVASMVFMFRILSRSGYYLLLIPIFLYIGSRIEIKDTFTWRRLGIWSALLLVFIVISVAECVYGVGWYASLRAYSFMSFVVLAFITYWSILYGKHLGEKKWMQPLAIAGMAATIGIGTYFFVHEYPMAKLYHDEVTARDNLIKEEVAKGRTEPLYVEAYTDNSYQSSYAIMRNALQRALGRSKRYNEPQFMYMRSSLSKDPKNWRNNNIRIYYHTQFDVVGWDEP